MYDWINLNVLAILSLFTISLTALYRYLTRHYNYFKSLGIDGPKPILFFGNLHRVFYKPFCQIADEDYKKYGRIYGWFFGTRPILMISEPQLIKDILIKDFHKFVDRNDLITGDPMSDRSIFNAMGDEWKQLRSVISPTFSSGKMRRMHPLIEDCVRIVVKILMKAANNKQEVELKKLMGNLTMDVIATCAFATKIDTHNEPNNAFIVNAVKVFRGSWKVWLTFITLFTFPEYVRKLKLPFLDSDATKFFTSAIGSIMKKRKNESKNHIDFLQLLLNAQKRVNLEESEDKNITETTNGSIYEFSETLQIDKSKFEISDTDIMATAFLFFIAGFETTATLLTFFCYNLALHEHCQQKLYEELKSAEKLDYDTIAQLPYLDACIAETQRLYTSVTMANRIATEDYKLGDTGITIPKGLLININIEGIHHDPENYPNPNHFDPERFMPENRHKLIPYTFLPFGIGPRNCVGMRFALMEAKTAIAHIITKFKFVRTANTVVPVDFLKLAFLLTAKSEIKVGVEIRNN